jgi:hypothetical protein
MKVNELRKLIQKTINELVEKEKPGLWANIRAKRKSGKPMAKKGSKAYKSAKKAGDKINKEIEEHTVTFTKDEMAKLHSDGEVTKADNKGKDHTYKFNELSEYYVDTVNENEAYCPVCTEAMLETVNKALNKIDEKKGKCKPSKGKRFAKRVSGKCRSYGQKGKAKKGGDRIRPGTAKGHAYCARSAKIKKCKNPPCANKLSRKKWKCQGSRSVPE